MSPPWRSSRFLLFFLLAFIQTPPFSITPPPLFPLQPHRLPARPRFAPHPAPPPPSSTTSPLLHQPSSASRDLDSPSVKALRLHAIGDARAGQGPARSNRAGWLTDHAPRTTPARSTQQSKKRRRVQHRSGARQAARPLGPGSSGDDVLLLQLRALTVPMPPISRSIYLLMGVPACNFFRRSGQTKTLSDERPIHSTTFSLSLATGLLSW